MAITKITINGDYSALQSFLQSSGLFGSVELGENTVTMKDGDGNTIATIGAGITITAYSNVTTSASATYYYSSSQNISYGYKCANGVLISVTAPESTSAYILIAKTNNNKIAFVFSNAWNANTAFYCVAWGDADVSTFTVTAKAAEQTLMCPFCTNANMGEQSYTPNAFWLPLGQYYNMGYGTLTMDGVNYLTNGYWCIKDA